MMLPTFCVYYTGTILRFSDFNVFPLNPFNSFFYHSEVTNLFWQKIGNGGKATIFIFGLISIDEKEKMFCPVEAWSKYKQQQQQRIKMDSTSNVT